MVKMLQMSWELDYFKIWLWQKCFPKSLGMNTTVKRLTKSVLGNFTLFGLADQKKKKKLYVKGMNTIV